MALSYVEYTGSKTTTDTYTIDFKFLDPSHVKLKVTTLSALVEHTNFTINSDGTIMTIGGDYDVPIKIYRQTPGTTSATKNDKVVDFQDGSVVSEADLDKSSLQALYASQESQDYVDDSIAASTGTGELPTTTNENYILASGTGGTPTPEWLSSTALQVILPCAVANTGNTIPLRSSAGTPAITANLTGKADSADVLDPGKTISLTGDVTYTSPIFTGAGDITAAASVVQVQGKAVSATTPTEAQTLVFRTDTWTPETPHGMALFAYAADGGDEGQTIVGKVDGVNTGVIFTLDYINTINAAAAGDCVLDTSTGIFLLKNGTYQIEWIIPFFSTNASHSVLMKSTATTVDGDGLLSVSPTDTGRANVAENANSGYSSSSHGFGRLTATTGTYVQVQAYAKDSGWLGASTDSAFASDFFHSIVIIRKE